MRLPALSLIHFGYRYQILDLSIKRNRWCVVATIKRGCCPSPVSQRRPLLEMSLSSKICAYCLCRPSSRNFFFWFSSLGQSLLSLVPVDLRPASSENNLSQLLMISYQDANRIVSPLTYLVPQSSFRVLSRGEPGRERVKIWIGQ